MRHLCSAALSVTLLLTAGCSAGTEVAGSTTPAVAKPSPDAAAGAAIEGVQSFPYEAPDHGTDRQSYAQSPPVGGDHWPPKDGGVLGWLSCGVYAEPVPAEFAVHSLEHGAVWLTYRPGTAAADVTTLAGTAALQPDYVLLSPYEGQPGAFTASAWGAQLSVEEPDDPRLAQFVRAFAGGGQGREQGAPCTPGTSPEDARAALDEANGGSA